MALTAFTRFSAVVWAVVVLVLAVCSPSVLGRNLGYILHLADLHLDPLYQVGSPATCFGATSVGNDSIAVDPQRKAGKFGDFLCDSPPILMQTAFEFISSKDAPTPDFVLWSGDDPGHHDLSQTKKTNLNAIFSLTEMFEKYLPGVQVWPALGNHDAWPVDQLAGAPANTWILKPLTEKWANWLPKDALTTFEKTGFYSVLLPSQNQNAKSKVRLITLSTTYLDANNEFLSHEMDPTMQLSWLIAELEASRRSGEFVWIQGHIPPGDEEATKEYSVRYSEIISAFSDIVKYQFFGHTHKDEFRLLRSEPTNSVTAVVFIAPSLVPFSVMNPSIRYYVYDRDTFEITDYQTYHADLVKSNAANSMQFTKSYSAKADLLLSDQSPHSYDALFARLTANSTLFQYYYGTVFNGNVTFDSLLSPICDADCRQILLCRLSVTNPDLYDSCVMPRGTKVTRGS